EITSAAAQAGRQGDEIERSACVLVVLDPSSNERPVPEGIRPLHGSMSEIADGLFRLAAAGADEAILVVSPITQRTVEKLGQALALLDADGS
ncbi:MAG: hypothetical protein ABSE47_14135, partial [Acidimicrobiales bacterium]